MMVLRENNVEFSKDTFRFYWKVLLEKHEDMFKCMICRLGEIMCLKFVFDISRVRAFKCWQNCDLLDFSLQSERFL
jgi:hypothetical protein